jgi:hypothetical protein
LGFVFALVSGGGAPRPWHVWLNRVSHVGGLILFLVLVVLTLVRRPRPRSTDSQ